MKLLTFLFLSALTAFSQVGPETNPTIGPAQTGYTSLSFRDGSNNEQYLCKAKSTQPSFAWTRSAATLTSIAVATNVGTVTTSTNHGLAVGNRVFITGATVDTDLNVNAGYIVATVGSATTFTIATSAVADATYTESTLIVSTTAPRSSAAMWSIWKKFYTTTYMDRQAWAEGSTNEGAICDNRASLAYN